ncbi:hypothetical protein POV27_06935 [Aureisphaera galaxeae]|uniref:hypothetical protein n=1 Tax=Aureisphaera galaxeae TaxID=1538023 RepID=UPI002350A401|nr:hypothetical protein [Aureisphaera galaxeae]MDC8003779.1 hypothetical protein [Aureisphaera galaxeae]
MKQVGIWLDKKEAYIISQEGEREQKVKRIDSEIESFRPHGGSGTRFKGGPQDVVQDSKYLEREKHQMKMYFDRICEYLHEADAIVVFGPAETGQKFIKELEHSHKGIAAKVKALCKADSMTENQMKAWVRDYFEGKNAIP